MLIIIFIKKMNIKMGLVANWENDLIPFEKWKELYDKMPEKCKKVVDDDSDDAPIGIGRNKEYGWFIACSGQGPFIAWTEKNERV